MPAGTQSRARVADLGTIINHFAARGARDSAQDRDALCEALRRIREALAILGQSAEDAALGNLGQAEETTRASYL